MAYNLLYDLDELNHVASPLLMVHLSVQGNFFDKHPGYKAILLDKFPNLVELDDLKVTPATQVDDAVVHSLEELLPRVYAWLASHPMLGHPQAEMVEEAADLRPMRAQVKRC